MALHRIALGFGLGFLFALLTAAAQPALAQFDDIQNQTVAPDSDAAAADASANVLTAEQLNELVAPVALYPDELLAIVLPAATQPLQIVEAQRFLEKHKADPNLKPDEDWDPSVLALINYPDVVKLMNDDLDWTQRLGNAVMDQQKDVLDAIQAARQSATSAGYLASNEQQTVTTDKETQTIIIESSNPEIIYVPTYDPTPIVEHHYTSYPPPVYAPYPPYYAPVATFAAGMFVGAAFSYGFNWGHGDIDIDCCEGGGNNNNINIGNGNGNGNINRDNIQNKFNGNRNPNAKGQNGMKWSPQKARTKSSAPRSGAKAGQRPTQTGISNQLKGGGAGGGARKLTPPSTRPAAQTKRDSARGNQSLGNNKAQRSQNLQNRTQQNNRAQQRPQQRQNGQQFKQKGGAFGGSGASQRTTRQQSNRGSRSMSGGGGGRGGGGGGGRGGGSVPRRR